MNPEPIDTGVRTDPAGGLHDFEPVRFLDREPAAGHEVWVSGCRCGWEALALDRYKADAKARWARHCDRWLARETVEGAGA